jgi:hypothetical protein
MVGHLIVTVKRIKTEPLVIDSPVVRQPFTQTRALVHITNAKSSDYRWVSDVENTESDHHYLLSQARRDAQSFILK